MSVIPDMGRLTVVSDPLGDLTFGPSGGTVLYYEARVYASGTSAPVLATKYLGVPGVDAGTGLIKVNIQTTLNTLPPGNYDVAVAAIGAGGTDESAHAASYIVPLQLP